MSWSRHTRGAAALVAVLLLGAASGWAFLAWQEAEHVERRKQAAWDDGRLFAMWLRLAHDATMVSDYRTALAADPDGFELAPASLPRAPADLPVPAGLRLGVMDDGGGVPMAWCVLAVDAFSRGPGRLGAEEAGLASVGVAGRAGTPMADREAGIAAALGSALAAGSLFATADRGLVHLEEAVYRRAQPGRPWASRMDAALDLAGNDIRRGGLVDARSAAVSGDAESRAGATVTGGVTALNASAGTAVAEAVTGAALRAVGSLETLAAEFSSAVTLRGAGGVPAGATVTGRIEAGSLASIGRVTAGLLVVGGLLGGGGALTLDEGLDARQVAVTGRFVSSGAASVRVAAAGGLDAGSLGAGDIAVAGDVFGPSATVTGTLTVGSCSGC